MKWWGRNSGRKGGGEEICISVLLINVILILVTSEYYVMVEFQANSNGFLEKKNMHKLTTKTPLNVPL